MIKKWWRRRHALCEIWKEAKGSASAISTGTRFHWPNPPLMASRHPCWKIKSFFPSVMDSTTAQYVSCSVVWLWPYSNLMSPFGVSCCQLTTSKQAPPVLASYLSFPSICLFVSLDFTIPYTLLALILFRLLSFKQAWEAFSSICPRQGFRRHLDLQPTASWCSSLPFCFDWLVCSCPWVTESKNKVEICCI